MDILILLILGWVLSGIVVGLILKKENIVRLLVITMLVYFSLYIIVSGLLFWIDAFNVQRVMLIICFLLTGFAIGGYIKKETFKIEWNVKEYIIPFMILLCAMPIAGIKYEYFGMGQDEGVYQTQAMMFVFDHNDLQQDLSSYYSLEFEESRVSFETVVQQELIGAYNYNPTLPFASEADEKSSVSFVFHGIPTFSAMLAIFGKIGGIQHMSDIQTIFYICSVLMVWFIMVDLNIKKTSRIVCTIVYAFSPIVLWTSKSALTEIGLAFFIVSYIYFILKLKRHFIYLSTVPLIAFCFYHLTIYTMLPVFVLIYIGLYVYSRKKDYLISVIILNTGFLVGITMMLMVAGTYSFVYNLKPLYRISFITQDNVYAVILTMCLCVYLICYLCYRFRNHVCKFADLGSKYKILFIRIAIVFGVLYQLIEIFEIRELFQGGINAIKHLTFVGFIFNSGIMIAVFAGVMMIINTKKIFYDIRESIMIMMFIYCIIIYSCFMYPHVNYYYYYARYISPYVAVAIICIALALEKVANQMILILGSISMFLLMPYEQMLYKNLDDTRLTWDALQKTIDAVDKIDVLLIRNEDMKFFYLPLSIVEDVICFPYTEAIEKELTEKGIKYYYLTQDEEQLSNAELYFDFNYMKSEDNNLYDGRLIPFPLDVTTERERISIWQKQIVK